ncbi:MAG: hypothetical protein GX171_06995 [Clostridiales bacterium]|jgi:hypothetical protein|nr:hypothetical protein [Clostridiales bacterium]
MSEFAVKTRLPNQDQSLIKLVAIITMIIDHVGVIFFPGVLFLRLIGRIAMPLFCWGIVLGAQRTRDWKKYVLRMLIMAFVSQPFYMWALNHSITQFSVMATLLLGLLAIIGMQKKWYYSHIWAPILCLIISASFQMDYGWRGVLLIILMHLARNSAGGLATLMTAFCLYWGAGGGVLPRGFVQFMTSGPVLEINRGVGELLSLFRVQSLAILALPLMLIHTKSGLKLPKWFSYLAYPGHLALLWLLKMLLEHFNLL